MSETEYSSSTLFRFLTHRGHFEPLYLACAFGFTLLEIAVSSLYPTGSGFEKWGSLGLLAAALIFASWFRPLGEIAYFVVAIETALVGAANSLPFMMTMVYAISAVWIRRSWITAGVLAFTLVSTALAVMSPNVTTYLISSGAGLLMVVAVGLLLRYQKMQVEQAERDQLAAEQASNTIRADLATQLHDTTAKDLARVVIAAQLLALRFEQPELQKELTALAELASTAAQRIRPVILDLDSSKTNTSFVKAVETSQSMLHTRAIELDVDCPAHIDKLLTRQQRMLGSLVVSECATNVLKYAPHGSQAFLIAEVTPETGDLSIALSNLISDMPVASGITGGFGLMNLEQRIASEGGHFIYTCSGSMWIIQATIPAN